MLLLFFSIYDSGWPKNLEIDNLGKKKIGKTWNFRNFENNLEKPGIFTKVMEKHGISYKKVVKPGFFFA